MNEYAACANPLPGAAIFESPRYSDDCIQYTPSTPIGTPT